MTTIVVLFNLLPDTDPLTYENWAKTVDIPNVRRLPGCSDFRVLKVSGLLGSDEAPPYAYSEIIEVDDMGPFGEAVGSEAMQVPHWTKASQCTGELSQLAGAGIIIRL